MGGAGIATAGAFLGAGLAAAFSPSTAVGITAFICAALVSAVTWCVAAVPVVAAKGSQPQKARGRTH